MVKKKLKFYFFSVILTTKEVITTTFKVISATTKVILDTVEMITSALKVILATKEAITQYCNIRHFLMTCCNKSESRVDLTNRAHSSIHNLKLITFQ